MQAFIELNCQVLLPDIDARDVVAGELAATDGTSPNIKWGNPHLARVAVADAFFYVSANRLHIPRRTWVIGNQQVDLYPPAILIVCKVCRRHSPAAITDDDKLAICGLRVAAIAVEVSP
jgi:hypothetical protein